MSSNNKKNKRPLSTRFKLITYDIIIFLFVCLLLLVVYLGSDNLSTVGIIAQTVLSGSIIFVSRICFQVYNQVWRYGGIQSYIKLLISDSVGFVVYFLLEKLLPIQHVLFVRGLSIFAINLLLALSMRMCYRYAYKYGTQHNKYSKFFCKLLTIFSIGSVIPNIVAEGQRIKVAIVGAGSVGIELAESLLQNSNSSYIPRCFIDIDSSKVGREIHGLPVYSEEEVDEEKLAKNGIQELIFALPQLSADKKRKLYKFYKDIGYKVKVYDYPMMENADSSKRALREFDIEELLFRKQIDVVDKKTNDYYTGKVVLITGGGGSIGSELCRQIAKMQPKQLIILDIFENGAYNVQQELNFKYKDNLDVKIEIVSVCNRIGLERVFNEYHPQIVLNAAAHKHVPLMEKNCIEAVENNVFGTLNTIELSEKYGVERFIMVSTDKAVNPTNTMGATKRLCEMIAGAHSNINQKTTFSATRFGNVLGSAGSVIPLFKRQIASGGPVTITDKRIIRYFMTIPEASQLVLQSGAMAKNGELFVLDMGNPVKIIDLAENMIKLSGMQPGVDIEIVETGLRPGEKLFEELLVKSETLSKTENELIFIEKDTPLSIDEINDKLDVLRRAVETNDDEVVKEALKSVVPTFKNPDDVNKNVDISRVPSLV